MKGSDVRRYRRSIGLNQARFARRLGVTQSALSRFEAGRIALSDEHVERLVQNFTAADFKLPFAEFLRQINHEAELDHPALTTELGRQLLLTVWRWEDGFDLFRIPAAGSAVGSVMIPFTKRATIAFEMPRSTDRWSKGEVLVFEECGLTEIRGGDSCLIQYLHNKSSITTLAWAELPRAGVRGVRLQSVLSRSGTIPEEALVLVMRARMRMLRP